MAAILTAIGTMFTSVLGWITSTITGVSAIFYDATDGFTFVGTLLLVAFGIGFVWVLINFIRGLVRRG